MGRECSVDKAGCAAIRAVELNIYLNGKCRIYRELEGEESPLFISYFEDDLEYLFGGTESSFRKVEKIQWEPRLYHITRLVHDADPTKSKYA